MKKKKYKGKNHVDQPVTEYCKNGCKKLTRCKYKKEFGYICKNCFGGWGSRW